MKTELIEPADLAHAAELLKSGKLVAFPTDTFFALGAVMSEEAVRSLFGAKGRMEGKPVPVLLSSRQQLGQVTSSDLTEVAARLAQTFWPGPLTIVLPADGRVPQAVTAGTGNIGVRVPDHDLARQLIELAGSPLTGTSANVSGQRPCKTAEEVLAQLNGMIAAVVNAPCGDHSDPSTVVGFDASGLTVLREGSISESEIRKVAEEGGEQNV